MKDVTDNRPVEDVIWFHEDYLRNYHQAGFEVVEIVRPLGKQSEPYEWINETQISPWVIYLLK
jgi:hypothetical protein